MLGFGAHFVEEGGIEVDDLAERADDFRGHFGEGVLADAEDRGIGVHFAGQLFGVNREGDRDRGDAAGHAGVDALP